ncbi:hypothetical protein K1W69_20485 [Hoeflea sp. WL0058]|uniref:Uncharacterized protein n=1 Tax=Flavimaribacter sediminis TaxID=2865987 RepID=A0AAE2ZRL8_9HYPH|nr:hypothetical protein [Flavimaribacter sediminis]MBW8639582.1 hypothetical protein [Flavimaribacter sediminis]
MPFAATGQSAFAANLGFMAYFLTAGAAWPAEPVSKGDAVQRPDRIELALSEIKEIETEDETGFEQGLPLPPKLGAPPQEESVERRDLPDVEVGKDLSLLPEPVRRMRELIVEAAKSGDPESLRPLLGIGPTATQLSFGPVDSDPIQYLKDVSGDQNGLELLAILLDIFDAGYARLDAGETTETYIWPYFYTLPLDALDDRQMVELFRIITAGDLQDMQAFGSYSFYRTGISPEGEWLFFLAGE